VFIREDPRFEILEIQLQAKLELPRIEGSRRAAVIATVVGPLVEGADIVDKLHLNWLFLIHLNRN
jgi:hypothetical protein